MPDVLAEILAHKRSEVERCEAERPIDRLRAMPAFAAPTRNFFGAVSAPRRKCPNLIAEIKRSSPSAGVIRDTLDPIEIARAYERGGAAALSILTDEKYFGGRIELIEQVKAAVGLPVLRKDFVISPYQVIESRAFGADAILLIAEALPPADVRTLAEAALDLGLCVLAEVHSRPALFEMLPALPRNRGQVLLGINNRDLRRQVVDLATTEQLAPLVPGLPIVSESGLRTPRDVERVFGAGARAVLIGEALLREADPEAGVRRMLGAAAAT